VARQFRSLASIIKSQPETALRVDVDLRLSNLDWLGRFQPGAQYFRYAPRLCDATAGHVWFTRVKDLADRTDAVVAQMDWESLKKFARRRPIVRMNFEPSVDEWPDQPGPNRSLMIGAIARTQIARINWFVIGTVWRKCPQADRRNQFLLDNFHNRFPMSCIKHGMIERDGEQLVGPA